jgi:MOSC domain-containing protein YiiM
VSATIEDFEPFIDDVIRAPHDAGTVELVVCRPAIGERRVLDAAELEPGRGLVGDNYVERGNARTPDGLADPLAELNVMSAHALRAVAGADRERWQLAGDQLIVDFDLSADNLPPGTRLRIGTAIIEVTAKPHTGCAKFSQRFGVDAARWVNSHKDLRLRGICAIVAEAGTVSPGDPIVKVG